MVLYPDHYFDNEDNRPDTRNHYGDDCFYKRSFNGIANIVYSNIKCNEKSFICVNCRIFQEWEVKLWGMN